MQIDPDSGSAITYGDLSIRVERMRSALYRIGVAHGDVMGTYAGNSSDFIIFCIAATSIGAIVTPINPAYKTCNSHIIQLLISLYHNWDRLLIKSLF